MKRPELGLTARLVLADGWSARMQEELASSAVSHLRLTLPPDPSERARAADVIAALAADCEVLPVLVPRLDGIADIPAAVSELSRRLPAGRGTIEIRATPASRSVWAPPVEPARLAAALREGAGVARAAGCRVAWSLGPGHPVDEEVDALTRHRLLVPGDALVLDLAGGAIEATWSRRLELIRAVVGVEALWLVAGRGTTQASSELSEHARALALPVDRLYWSGMRSGAVARLWSRAGASEATRLLETTRPTPPRASGRVLVTGGAGFVGSNLCARLIERGRDVVVLDDLGRPGVERNLAWLRERFGSRLTFVPGDVRSKASVRGALEGVEQVFHLAAQVAVTTSLEDPKSDFDVNASGTLNLLEEVRRCSVPPALVFTSTNKVYGDLSDVALEPAEERWVPADRNIRSNGIGESRRLALHSPYGCSKGAGDQYVLDHAKSFGLRTLVFRMSCIYGPRQFGDEDQGWVAHFMRCALEDRPLTVYGDGKQVRDLLFIDDLTDALILAGERIDRIGGHAYNMGGGPANTISLRELLERIAKLRGRPVRVEFESWRRGDQRYYVSDTRRFRALTGWRPKVDVEEGLARLWRWLRDSVAARDSGVAGADVSVSSSPGVSA